MELFPTNVPIELSRLVFPTIIRQVGDHTDFVHKETAGSSMLDHDLGHLCFGRRIQMSGHSDFGIFINDGASSILTWV